MTGSEKSVENLPSELVSDGIIHRQVVTKRDQGAVKILVSPQERDVRISFCRSFGEDSFISGSSLELVPHELRHLASILLAHADAIEAAPVSPGPLE